MAVNVNKNFIGARMNKAFDERLIPPGQYIDMWNLEIGTSDDGEAGAAHFPKGNSLVASLSYEGASLTNAKTLGALEDGTRETIYWAFTSDEVDGIVSFNTNTGAITYHVLSETVLNFEKRVQMDLIDNILFFNDNFNPPRRINITYKYKKPISGVDQITEDDISVIMKPPKESPSVSLINNATKSNYIEDKFIRFATRFKYKNGEYSAPSEFSDLAFSPRQFRLDYSNYDMVGMRNAFNSAKVAFKTGPKEVVGIDLLFKSSNSSIINIVEKYDKHDMGWNDDNTVSIEFDNQKIYSTLPASELLRMYDNVPLLAGAQTTMGNRIMYGNYVDGYDIDEYINFDLELINEDVGLKQSDVTYDSGTTYTLGGSVSVTSSKLLIDMTGIPLTQGSVIYIDFNILHDSFGGDASYVDGNEIQNKYDLSFSFIFPRDYTSVADLATDQDFIDSIQTNTGYSLTDLFYDSIVANPAWIKNGQGITSNTGAFAISYSGSVLGIQLPAIEFTDIATGTLFAYEYFYNSTTSVAVAAISSNGSLHSNRDYEVCIIYKDGYQRASTALVTQDNTLAIGPQFSTTKNSIRATIKNNPPSWAKRYTFGIKPSKASYETVYSNIYYLDTSEGSWWIKLEGDNQTKVQPGQSLIVKSDSTGPIASVVKTKALDIKVQEPDFITGVTSPSGVYMRVKPSNFTIEDVEDNIIDNGHQTVGGQGNRDMIYPAYIPNPSFGDPGEPEFLEYDIPAGSQVFIDWSNVRFGSGSRCGSRYYKFEGKEYVATRDYANLYDFLIGENVDFTDPSNNPAVESSDDTTPSASWDPSIGDETGLSILNETIFGTDIIDIPKIEGVTQLRYYRHSDPNDGRAWLGFKRAGNRCNGKRYRINAQIVVVRSGGLLVFETEPAENETEVYFESHESFPITGGFHTGNIQDQTASDDCIVDINLYNCFTFGNGVESFKIDDALAEVGFRIGARVTQVSEQDYKRAERYSDITYSGVYNAETNINRLNEFNLGLSNFKTLEKSFGPIRVLEGRQTDLLCLQEDKISYVLAGKNLLSDATGGGAIFSSPEVLGTQIARTEEYGISNDEDSFVMYGPNVFFTDTKRGAVINLKGGSYKGDQLSIISDFDMDPWFRDQFIEKYNNIKLGGYDPFNDQYVLTFTDTAVPAEVLTVSCGYNVSQVLSSTPVTYNVELEDVLGTSTFNYDLTAGTANIVITYNGVEVVNEAMVGTGTVTFNKDSYAVNECQVTITPVAATYSIDFDCIEGQELTIIRVVAGSPNMEGETIHHETQWIDGTYESQILDDYVSFSADPVSLYEIYSGEESVGYIPTEGSTMYMRYRKDIGDSASFDGDKFRYFLSDTLFSANDIALIKDNAIDLTTVEITPEYLEGSFVYDNPTDLPYLYLLWDYDEPTIACNDALSTSGNAGYYEVDAAIGTQTGDVTVTFNAQGVPDRMLIYYDDILVADSLFVGDSITASTYIADILATTSLTRYVFNGTNFDTDGTEAVSFDSGDISDSGTSRPTSGDGSVGNQIGVVGGYPAGTPLASDGDVKLTFSKNTSFPTTMKIVIIGCNAGTAWNITNVECPGNSFLSATDDEYVFEFGNTSFSVLDNDLLGTGPTTITNIDFSTFPADYGTLAINGSNIDFTAGATLNTSPQTFTYTITDSLGNTDTATVTISAYSLAEECREYTLTVNGDPSAIYYYSYVDCLGTFRTRFLGGNGVLSATFCASAGTVLQDIGLDITDNGLCP